jgi:hypothetical protein
MGGMIGAVGKRTTGSPFAAAQVQVTVDVQDGHPLKALPQATPLSSTSYRRRAAHPR